MKNQEYESLSLSNSDFANRVNILLVGIVIFGIILIERLFIILLRFTYSIEGNKSLLISSLILLISLNFLVIIYHFIIKLGTGVLISIKNIKDEWLLLSPLNKIISVSGLVSLPVTLLPVFRTAFLILYSSLEYAAYIVLHYF